MLPGFRVASTKREAVGARVKAGCLDEGAGGLPRRVIAGRRPGEPCRSDHYRYPLRNERRLSVATTETNSQLGAQIREDAKRYVIHSWSVQDAINPLPVAGAEGRYFWDYDGRRYLDFASQLVNVSIGHQHPKLVAAIKEQADKLCTIGPGMA